MAFYVTYPPDGDEPVRPPGVDASPWDSGSSGPTWKPITIGIEPEYHSTARAIRKCKVSFDETSNPLYAIEAFRLATEARIYPPLWAIGYINSRFQWAIRDRITLDQAFDFSSRGAGSGNRTNPIEEDQLRGRNRLLCLAIFKLEGAGLSRRQATEALASLLSRMPEGQTLQIGGGPNLLRGMTITGAGIRSAIQQAETEWAAEKAETADAAKGWSAEEKRELLSVFYPSELPKRWP